MIHIEFILWITKIYDGIFIILPKCSFNITKKNQPHY